jgi:hypothetical protein
MYGQRNGTAAPAPRVRVDGVPATALGALLASFEEAERRGCSRWQIGVSRQQLRKAGLAGEPLLDLLVAGLMERSGDQFALTPKGVRAVRAAPAGPGADVMAAAGDVDGGGVLPCYDADLRRLTLGGLLVKVLPDSAVNQEVVLLAFQEEGWPRVIDDPLPGVDGLDARQRLKDTVTRLNRSQREARVVFHRLGRGTRVRWEVPGRRAD